MVCIYTIHVFNLQMTYFSHFSLRSLKITSPSNFTWSVFQLRTLLGWMHNSFTEELGERSPGGRTKRENHFIWAVVKERTGKGQFRVCCLVVIVMWGCIATVCRALERWSYRKSFSSPSTGDWNQVLVHTRQNLSLNHSHVPAPVTSDLKSYFVPQRSVEAPGF